MPLPKMIPEVAVPTPECPHPERWHCYDGMSTEVEILGFIYALVRMLKPTNCVETGTYLGFGTYYIAQALKDNGEDGLLRTAEPNNTLCAEAQTLVKEMGVSGHVCFYGMTGQHMIYSVVTGKVDFAFLDSNLETRIREMQVLLPKLADNGVVAVHDTNTHHDRPGANGPRTPFLQFAEAHGMQVINFDTPRGLMLLRRKP